MRCAMPKVASLVMSASVMIATTTPIAAQDRNQDQNQAQNQSETQARAPNPYTQPNDSWITIEGTVQSVQPNSFSLAYGGGTILVEMDDGDRDADAYVLQQGDSVTVTGKIDDDLFESATIEASTVYLPSISTYFYASAMDEEDAYSEQGAWWMPHHGVSVLQPRDQPTMIIRGRVTEITDDDEFTIDQGTRQVTVDVDELENNPLDDEGYQKIDVGDYVSVQGEMDDDLFEGRELKATSVITLWDTSS